jgi:cytosine/adenosine deaminase-related metal-dependent hydrolase
MRKVTADYIFPISQPPVKNGLLVLDDHGYIVEFIHHPDLSDISIEKYAGILCPGFVNAHCHLELSYLKGKIARQTGLDHFIKEVTQIATPQEEIASAIVAAEKEMVAEGIVAVGDISNGPDSFLQKSKGNLRYHTFIEVLGFHPDRAQMAFEKAVSLYHQIKETLTQDHSVSITPHAPYSASEKLLKLIHEFALQDKGPLTIHNQESEEENKFFQKKEGSILSRLQNFGIDASWWQPTGKNSLESTLKHLSKINRLQLVHNTVTNAEDIRQALQYNDLLWWCFCPNANVYIENKLPDFKLFLKANARITIGTDSLASNNRLSVLEELKTIALNAPNINLETLLSWATRNGAEFLGFDKDLGTFEKGKRPGINLIEEINLNTLSFTTESKVRRLA